MTSASPAVTRWHVWHVDYEGADRIYEASTRAAARWIAARAWLNAGYDRHGLGRFLAGLRCERVGATRPDPRPSAHDVFWSGAYRGADADPRETGWCETCGREVYDGDSDGHRGEP